MAGIGASIGVAVAYLAIGQLFEKIGNVNYLPAAIAAWSPNAIFSLAGMYVGQVVRRRTAEQVFRRGFFIGLLALGTYMCLRSLAGAHAS